PGLCEGFNIDVGHPRVFQGPPESQFGYRVLQWGTDGDKWLLVGAPWDGNGQGDIYKCGVGLQNSSCAKANLGDGGGRWMSPIHVVSSCHPPKACAPLWSQECGTSVFSSGRCVQLNEELQLTGTIAPTAQRCSTYMDIILVLDGSNSIYPWEEVQAFLGNILGRFFIGPGQTQVGVLQYGERLVQEWALGQHPTAQRLLEAARNLTRQEGRETRTAMAIRQACTESFSPAQGGRPGATRLLLVVTDGESHDGDELPAALAECDRHNVTRYAIAVSVLPPGPLTPRSRGAPADPCPSLRSWGTTCVGSRIPRISSGRSNPSPATRMRMSRDGRVTLVGAGGTEALQCPRGDMSHPSWQDGILFGMVGAYDWEGGVLEESQRGRVVPPREAFQEEFPLELKNHAAYLGYSVSSLQLPGGQRLFVAGAPRFQHKGKVVLFQLDPTGTVTVAQALMGEQVGGAGGLEGLGGGEFGPPTPSQPHSPLHPQIGSYFGSEDRLIPAGSLRPEPRPQDSRFGSALGAVPNLSQDGLAGAVVGAPLEDGHRGALYVFHGAPGTLLPQYKQ
ncbi:ITA10 protein, partial [Dryoscopus gambensis]|nr:ITA10 protein [Dryoscopus gambensis]